MPHARPSGPDGSESRIPAPTPGWIEVAPGPPVPSGRAQPSLRWGFAEWFVVGQLIGPAILFLPGTQPFRIVFRVGVFALGLLGLVLARRSATTRRHPSEWFLTLAMLYVALMIFHPATNTRLAGVAQTFLDLAVVAPLFWAPAYFRGDPIRLARVLTIIWVFNGASATVGILQVRDPDRWLPAEFSTAITKSTIGVAGLSYRTHDNQKIVRPPGLGDAPGAACNAGLMVASMGLAYLALPVSNTRRALGLVGVLVGVTVIFLTHVRSALVMLVGSAVVLIVILTMQRRVGSALLLSAAMGGCGVVAVGYAAALGGQSTIDRFATLIDADPLTVYDRSARMGMVTSAFDTLLFEYPLGAGLGRFGMMRGYFGSEENMDSPPIWVEVQMPGWIVEGGIVLLVLYTAAILVAIGQLLWIASRHRSAPTRQWAGTVIMLSASPVAFMFSYCPFYGQMGMQFWFLIGAMAGAAQDTDPAAGPPSGRHRARSDRSASPAPPRPDHPRGATSWK